MKLYDGHGNPVSIGEKIGHGGEGDVYEVIHSQKWVAKIYHKSVSAEKEEKLHKMVILATPVLLELTAWPLDILRDRVSGNLVGFLMPRIDDFKPIHLLYGPKSRQHEFPDAEWPFLLQVSANISYAFSIVHEQGHVIGDVNHGNLLVNDQGMVKFIDCDSFQICEKNCYFLCEVGVSTHTPPELQCVNFRTARRTHNHDVFGLAVILFQMLAMGRHPFSGNYTGTGEVSLEKAIQEHRFAYGSGAISRKMQQPPGTLDLVALGPTAPLFERAFLQDENRPTAMEWQEAISVLQDSLAQCKDNPSHYYFNGLSTCPWCPMEHQISLFITAKNLNSESESFDITPIWANIKSILPPASIAMPNPSDFSCKTSISVKKHVEKEKIRLITAFVVVISALIISRIIGISGWLAILLGLVVMTLEIVLRRTTDFPEALQAKYYRAVHEFNAFQKEWIISTGDSAFLKKRSELARLKLEYENLPEYEKRKILRLKNERQENQRTQFLSKFRIENVKIAGIGNGHKATLQSYGIETAADIDGLQVLEIPGIGVMLTNQILEWRDEIAARFIFEPNKEIDPIIIAKLKNRTIIRRRQIETSLTHGETVLHHLVEETKTNAIAKMPQAKKLAKNLAQAKVDWEFIR
ncbi:putative Protein kinase YegI [Gammaproteobacteria bacterium]